MSYPRKEQLFAKMSALAATIDWPRIIGRIPNAVREIPARLPVTDKCAENWLSGRAKPNGDNVVMLLAQFDEVVDEVLALARRTPEGLTFQQRRKLKEILGDE